MNDVAKWIIGAVAGLAALRLFAGGGADDTGGAAGTAETTESGVVAFSPTRPALSRMLPAQPFTQRPGASPAAHNPNVAGPTIAPSGQSLSVAGPSASYFAAAAPTYSTTQRVDIGPALPTATGPVLPAAQFTIQPVAPPVSAGDFFFADTIPPPPPTTEPAPTYYPDTGTIETQVPAI